MSSVRFLMLVGAATLMSGAAHAADLGAPPPVVYPPQPVFEGGWYLRGDVGVGIASSNFEYLPNPANAPVDVLFQNSSNGDTFFINGGVGYEVNNWLRFDVTGEYRSKTDAFANIFYGSGGGVFGDTYHGFLQSWVLLANAYVDLGTWWCITPFIGAGVGGAFNTMADLTDDSTSTPNGGSGGGVGRNSSSWSPAWALYAGLAYNVTENFKVEMSYRYLNYGSVTDTIDCYGGCTPDSYKFGNLSSQDIMLGFRYLLLPEPAPVALSTRD